MESRILTALPVFNESRHVSRVLDAVRQHSRHILVVDDGSTDDTAEVLSCEQGIEVVTHPVNRGYGAALDTAFRYALDNRFDVLVTIDCDGQHEPQLIPGLVAAMEVNGDTRVDLVSGSRYLQQFDGQSLPPEDRRRINHEITGIINERLGLQLTDTFCGFKAYRVSALKDLRISEFGYAMPLQLWVQAVQANWSIVEFPVPLVYLEEERSFGGSLDDARRRMTYYLKVIDDELGQTSVWDESGLDSTDWQSGAGKL
jgi:glycosyltransferase involved in cell wall biosynthesis